MMDITVILSFTGAVVLKIRVRLELLTLERLGILLGNGESYNFFGIVINANFVVIVKRRRSPHFDSLIFWNTFKFFSENN